MVTGKILAFLKTLMSLQLYKITNGKIILRAREGNTTVTLTYDIPTGSVTLVSEEVDASMSLARFGRDTNVNEWGFYLQLDKSNDLAIMNTMVYNGISYDLSLLPTSQEVGISPHLAIAIPLAVVLGQALLNTLIATVLTITVAGVVYVIATSVTQELSRNRPNNHFMAQLRNGQLFIGNGITLATSQRRVRGGLDVWSPTSALARAVIPGSAVGPQNHYRNGSRRDRNFDHFHPNPRTGGHSFFAHGRNGLRNL